MSNNKKYKITVLANDLYQFLHTYRFASSDEYKEHLSRVMVNVSGGYLTFVATDGHVMTVAKMKAQRTNGDIAFFLSIPHIESAIQYIKKYMGDGFTPVEVSITDKFAAIEVANSDMKVYLKKYDTDDFPFPDYRKVIIPRDRKNEGGGNNTALQPIYLTRISEFFSLFEYATMKKVRINYGYGKEPTLFYADLPEDGASLDVFVMPMID